MWNFHLNLTQDTGRAEIGFDPTVEDWESADTTDIEI